MSSRSSAGALIGDTAGSGNRTRATLVGGECPHHCAIPAPLTSLETRNHARIRRKGTERGAVYRLKEGGQLAIEQHKLELNNDFLNSFGHVASSFTRHTKSP